MFAGKKIAMQMSFGSKHFCKFCTMFGPQKGSWKMDPKMVPEFDPQNGVQKMAPQNGVQKWHPKMGSKNGTPKGDPMESKNGTQKRC